MDLHMNAHDILHAGTINYTTLNPPIDTHGGNFINPADTALLINGNNITGILVN